MVGGARSSVGRAVALYATAPRFDPWRAYGHCTEAERKFTLVDPGVAQSGSAPALGAGGRRFESSRPDTGM